MNSSAEERQTSHGSTGEEEEEPCSYAIQLVTSSMLPMVMQTSIDLPHVIEHALASHGITATLLSPNNFIEKLVYNFTK